MSTFSNMREALLAQEQIRPEAKSDYERRLNAMFEKELAVMHKKTLSPVQRIAFTLSGLMCFGFFVGFGYVGLFTSAGLPWLARSSFFAGSLFGLVFAVASFWVVVKGYYHRRRFPNLYTGGVWGIVVIQSTVAMMLAGNMSAQPYHGTIMLLSSLVFLVMGVAFLLKNVMEQSTLKVQEDILRMQIQLAELTERLAQGEPPSRAQ